MSRKVYLTVHVPLILVVDEGVEMQQVIDDLQISATVGATGNANLEDVGAIQHWVVTDSK